MGLWRTLFGAELDAMKPPKKLKIYWNKETGDFALDVVNQPNKLVPVHSKVYTRKGLYISESHDEETETDFWQRISAMKKKDKLSKSENLIEYGDD
jgi:hypothetical protein